MRGGVIALGLLATLAGCTSGLDSERLRVPERNPDVQAVRAEPDRFEGRSAVWGGTIVSVENGAAHSRVTVLARALDRRGRPRVEETSSGRFIARFDGFLDPAVYAPGSQITVAGTVAGTVTGKIGEFDYTFPVLSATDHRHWRDGVRDRRYSRHHYPGGYGLHYGHRHRYRHPHHLHGFHGFRHH